MSIIHNDKGNSSTHPCGLFCTRTDVESWARTIDALQAEVGLSVAALAPGGTGVADPASNQALVNELVAWHTTANFFEGFDDLDLLEPSLVGESMRSLASRMARDAQRGLDLRDAARDRLGSRAPTGLGVVDDQVAEATALGLLDVVKLGAAAYVGFRLWEAIQDRRR